MKTAWSGTPMGLYTALSKRLDVTLLDGCRSKSRAATVLNGLTRGLLRLRSTQQVLEDECTQLAKRLSLDETPVVYPCIANDARCITMRVACSCEAEENWALEREIRMSMFERLRREGIKP